MKRFSFVFIVAFLLVSLTGCALFRSPDTAFVAAVDAGLNGGPSGADILNKYDKYVDADSTLTADTKKIEHATAAKLRKLIADAKK